MILVMNIDSTLEEITTVNERLEAMGFQNQIIQGVKKIVIGAVGDPLAGNALKELTQMPGVEKIVPIMKPFKLVSREAQAEGSIIEVGNVKIGGQDLVVIAGP